MPERFITNDFIRLYIKLRRTSNLFFEEQAQIAKRYDLTAQQLYILQILRGHGDESVTINELIQLSVDKQSNASRLVDKLVNKGLVERKTDPEDRRKVGVSLSQAGHKKLREVDKAIEPVKAQLSGIPEESRSELVRLLNLVDYTLKIRNEDTATQPFRIPQHQAQKGNNAPQVAQRDNEPD